MFEGWKRERTVRRVLRGIARQRVALVAQPGNLWVIERALERNDDIEAGIATCVMRGWIEPLFEDLPTNTLTPEGRIRPGPLFTRTENHYKLTEGGWAAINRTHLWAMVGVLVGAASLIATFLVASGGK